MQCLPQNASETMTAGLLAGPAEEAYNAPSYWT